MRSSWFVIKALLPLLLLAGLCAGCTSVSVRKSPKLDLSQFQRVFVVQPFNENRHVDELFVEALRHAGRSASSGPQTMMPENTDAVLTYEARWSGDFTTNLIDLTIELHTAHTDKRLAEGRYFQPSAWPKPAPAVVRALVAQLYAK